MMRRLGTMLSMIRRGYQTDLSDEEWALIEPHLPSPKTTGRPHVHTPREILYAVVFFYVLRSSGAWRLLHHDFPPWKKRLAVRLYRTHVVCA